MEHMLPVLFSRAFALSPVLSVFRVLVIATDCSMFELDVWARRIVN